MRSRPRSYAAARQRQHRRDRIAAAERGASCLVRLDLFGGLEAIPRNPDAGVPPGTKPLALLAYLHLAGPTARKSRDELVSLFWPDLDQGRGRRALRQAVFQLRESFGEEVVVSTGKHWVTLTSGVVWSDVQLFRGLCTNERWEGALDLYRGDFLRGVHVPRASWELGDWIEEERAGLRVDAADCALRMAEAAARAEDHRSAVDWAEHALTVSGHSMEILDDFLHFCASVRRADLAWRVYDQHVLWLRRGGHPGPDPATRALFERLFPELEVPGLEEWEG